MVAFASVIAMDTAIIILDEPTTGQDAVMLARMSEIIQHLAGLGKTIIAITHDIDFAAENFTRLIAMSQGAIILDGPILDVIDHDEVLATTFVEPPQITRLGKALGFMHPVTTTQAFLDELAQQRKIFQM
jgi:energy-coupling factor transport system ATP-binding protein